MSAPDRGAYAVRQAQLLDALLRGEDFPAGFAAPQADAAGRALRRKRGRAIADAWPALALSLGDAFEARFDAFERVAAAGVGASAGAGAGVSGVGAGASGAGASSAGASSAGASSAGASSAGASGDPLRDGLAFARWIQAEGVRLDDDARVEVLLARAALRRHGPWARAARLRSPYPRLLVVARLPFAGIVRRSFAVRPPQHRGRGT